MKRKPIFEYTDKRVSERYAEEERKRQKQRNEADRKMGSSYFTNTKGVDYEIRTSC